MPKRANWRSVKCHRNYTVDEVARTLNVAKGTVRRWTKTGLPVLNEQRPVLMLGQDLIDYLKQRKVPKQKCALDECYCFSCKAPRQPAFNQVEYHPANAKNGNLRALCIACTTVMHKRTSLQKLTQLALIVEVETIPKAGDKPGDPPTVRAKIDHFRDQHEQNNARLSTGIDAG